jgi:thioredoxin reductase
MKDQRQFDIIIIGGSYSGLAAAMALGRAMRQVLIIDEGKPCNRQTPYSHNFLTQDGTPPTIIARLAKQQVQKYESVSFLNGVATEAAKTLSGFEVQTKTGKTFTARKLIFATGIRDIMPDLPGFAECWGRSVLHCPYCHGYEVRNVKTGILGNGDYAFEFAALISNWTKDLTVFTNGKSTLTQDQTGKIASHGIKIIETEIEQLQHTNGTLESITLKGRTTFDLNVLYARPPFEQSCPIPKRLGCAMTDEDYIQVDSTQKTTIAGVYACGDNVTRIRTVANAVAMGTTTGLMINRELVQEEF